MSLNDQLFQSTAAPPSAPRARRSPLLALAATAVVAVVAVAGVTIYRAGSAGPIQGVGRPVPESGGLSNRSADPSTSAGKPSTSLASIVVQPGDLPGWSASADSGDQSDSGDSGDFDFAACVGGRDTSPDLIDWEASPTFDRGQTSVDSEVDSFRTQSDIDSDVAALRKPKFASCVAQTFTSGAGLGGSEGDVKVSKVHVTVGLHASGEPSNVVGHVTVDLTASQDGQSAAVQVSTTMIAGPRLEVSLVITSIDQPVPSTLRTRLTNLVAARAAHA